MEKEDKIIIGIAGLKLSGKTQAADFLVEKFKAKRFRFSKILDQILETLDLPISRENEQELATILRKDFGDDILAQALLHSADKSNSAVVVIDGFRKLIEVEAFKRLGNFKLIYLKTPIEIAYSRAQTRPEKAGEHAQTFEQFVESADHIADKDISGLEQYADFVIENQGTLEDLHVQLTSAFTRSL